ARRQRIRLPSESLLVREELNEGLALGVHVQWRLRRLSIALATLLNGFHVSLIDCELPAYFPASLGTSRFTAPAFLSLSDPSERPAANMAVWRPFCKADLGLVQCWPPVCHVVFDQS